MLAVLRNVNIANLTYSSPTPIYSTPTHTHTSCLCSMHLRAHLLRQCLLAHAQNLVLPCQLLLLVHSCKVSKSSISENLSKLLPWGLPPKTRHTSRASAIADSAAAADSFGAPAAKRLPDPSGHSAILTTLEELVDR